MGFAIAHGTGALQVLAERSELRIFSVVIGKGNLTMGSISKNAHKFKVSVQKYEFR